VFGKSKITRDEFISFLTETVLKIDKDIVGSFYDAVAKRKKIHLET